MQSTHVNGQFFPQQYPLKFEYTYIINVGNYGNYQLLYA